MPEVIEIASDSEEDRIGPAARKPPVIVISSSDDDQHATTRPSSAKGNTTRHRATRKIIESNSESEVESPRNEAPDNDTDLTLDGSSKLPTSPVQDKSKKRAHTEIAPIYQSLYSDNEDSANELFEDALDDSIITYNPPHSAKKPIKITPLVAGTSSREVVPKKRTRAPERPTTPAKASTSRSSGKTSKRAQAAAERKELEQYAQQFFDDLNRTVFGDGLPRDTKLAWNTRLLTTAGRARWHKNRHGEESSQIELATKILTCKERIRNTLSHEMCHLASWVIDKQVNEGHGQIFKKWGSRVMEAHPDVEVTTRHTYEISYKYEWECANCSKTYGRHSKSINPDECLCGACKTGKLIPLFTTRALRKPKNAMAGRMTSAHPRDSPIRGIDLRITAPTDDPWNFLDDLTAAVEGIKV